jgi:O-antigen/teichoic acid export membrane protein
MSVKKKFSISFISRIISFIASFISFVIISRALGPESNGIYRYIMLIASTSYLITNLGIFESNNQRLALNKVDKNTTFLFNFFWATFIFILILILLIIYYYVSKSNLSTRILLIGIIYLLLYISNYSISSVITGMHKINEFNILNGLKLLLLLVAVILLKATSLLSIERILYSQILVSAFYLISGLFIVKPEIDFTLFKKEISLSYLKAVFRRGIIIYISNISTFLNYRLDMFLLKFFSNFRNIGLYSVAVSIVEKLWIIPESIRSIVFLEIAGKRKNENFVAQVTRIQLAFVIIVSIIFLISAKWFIPILYSDSYVESVEPFILLLPGVVFFSLSKVLASYFVGIDKIHINTISSVVGFLVNIIMNILLIPRFGIIGAAIATSISYSIGGIILLIQFTTIAKISVLNTLVIQKDDIYLIKSIHRKIIKKL